MIAQVLAWGIVAIICFCFAPFMTIGFIFLFAKWKILGFIFIVLGLFNMILRLINYYDN